MRIQGTGIQGTVYLIQRRPSGRLLNSKKGESAESDFAFGDLIGEDGTGCLIAHRGGATHADTIMDDAGFIARKRGTDFKITTCKACPQMLYWQTSVLFRYFLIIILHKQATVLMIKDRRLHYIRRRRWEYSTK